MEKSFEWWIENIMDDRLEYLDSHEKYKLYNEWLEKNNNKERIKKIMITEKELLLYNIKNGVGLNSKDISDKLRDDKEFMLELIEYYACALRWASRKLLDDTDFLLSAVKANKELVEYGVFYREIKKHPDIVSKMDVDTMRLILSFMLS